MGGGLKQFLQKVLREEKSQRTQNIEKMNDRHRMLFLALLTMLLASFSATSQTRVLQSPAPIWIEEYAYNDVVDDSSISSNGYAYLLISVQNHLEKKEFYRSYAIKVVSEQGLSFASSINESFDPAFQKIFFHSLNIIRGGRRINKLDIGKFEAIRREEQMDRGIYDKTVNAVYNMPGVRVGDIIEYSYTVKGFNPVFADHVFGNMYLQYGVPVAKFAHRLVFRSDRALNLKSFGDTPKPAVAKKQNFTCYEWIRENVPALLVDDDLPSWYDPYAHVQYSDFQSWNDVKAWALNVFNLDEPKDSELNSLIEQITAQFKNDEERIKECIRIVQGEIRYLSFSDGIHGYKPHAPELVFGQKYGDCKDKSLLLSYLLRGVGIESYPSLVSTEIGKILNDVLPSPWAFNHCIVQFNYKDSTYWIDPTLRPQVGPLKRYFFPSYENALVIDDGVSGLDPIPYGYKDSKIEVVEEYSVREVGGYVTLNVETAYHGDEADRMRNYIKTNTKEEIHKNYLNFYANDYAEISLTEDVTFNDNQTENIITSKEAYLVKDFWGIDPEKGKIAYLYARVLSSYVNRPETKLRTMPLAVTYPRQVYQTIKIFLPEEWNIDDTKNNIESDGFSYHSSAFYNDKTITLRYSYKAKQSFVKAESTADHLEKTNEVLGDISYMIYKPLPNPGDGRAKEFLVVGLLVAVAVYAIRKRFS